MEAKDGFEARPAGLGAAASLAPAALGLAAPFVATDTLDLRRALAHNEIMARSLELARRLGRSTLPPQPDGVQSDAQAERHTHLGRLDFVVVQRVARSAGGSPAGGRPLRVAGGH